MTSSETAAVGGRANGFWRFEFWGADEAAERRRVRALFEAEGFSIGRRQRGALSGILFGAYDIQKWRNLRLTDRQALHGTLNEDTHPIVASFPAGQPDDVDAALQRVNQRDFEALASAEAPNAR